MSATGKANLQSLLHHLQATTASLILNCRNNDNTSAEYKGRIQHTDTIYRVNPPKMFQHENYAISEIREYFFYQILLICLQDNCAKVCCFVLYLLGIRQINVNANFRDFATALKVDVIKVSSGPPLLQSQCRV